MHVNEEGNGVSSVEIVRADPRERRRALVVVAVGAVLGSIAITWVLPWVEHSAAEAVRGGLPKSVVCRSTLVGLMLFTLPLIAFGVYAFRFGRQVALEQRFPPSGRAVVRDTRVLHGRAAATLGRVQSMLGASVVALSFVLLGILLYGFHRLSAG